MYHANKFIVLLFILSFSQPRINAQIIGGNGEGLTTVVSDEDIPYLLEITKQHPIAIRWPGGSDSKLAFPSLDKPGLGSNSDSIRKLYNEFLDPKGLVKESSLTKDLKQVANDSKRPQSALMDLIQLSRKVPGLQVDYCLNILQGTVESNISAIRTLIDSGVNIISLVAGNETFYANQYHFEKYQNDFEPILRACAIEFPAIPRLLCIGQEIEKKPHIAWNTATFDYIKANGDFISGVDVHYYLMEELKPAIQLHPQFVTYQPGRSYEQLDLAFAEYIRLTNEDRGMEEIVDYLNENLPGKLYHCTEFGDKHAEYWSNTIANGGRIFTTFCKHRNDFDILLVHNLLGNWLWAARRPVGKLDDNPENTEKLNRVQWYAIQMANELPFETSAINDKITLDKKGEYFFYFNNVGAAAWTPTISTGRKEIKEFEIHYVSGQHTYSSAGGTGFMDKNSSKSFEVKGITILHSGNVEAIPFNSFGYVRIVIG